VIYDSDAQVIQIRRVEYDVVGAQETILAAGLPALLADRLSFGK
jgi:hypothetical protein